MKILLIAGHGAGDPGAVSKINGKTYREADETRNLVPLIEAELRNHGVEAIVRDMRQNAYFDYQAGRLFFPKADLLIEVHFNAFRASAKDGKTKGVECYITNSETETKTAAQICKAVSAFGLSNRGVKRTGSFAVIKKAKSNGICANLLEVCFIDDADDMAIYLSNRKKIAEAIAKAICDANGIKWSAKTDRKIVQEEYGFNDETMAFLDKHPFPAALYDRMARKAEQAKK